MSHHLNGECAALDHNLETPHTDINEDDQNKMEAMISAHVELIAKKAAVVTDAYILLHVLPRPKWMPQKLYEFVLSKVLVLARFKKPKYIWAQQSSARTSRPTNKPSRARRNGRPSGAIE